MKQKRVSMLSRGSAVVFPLCGSRSAPAQAADAMQSSFLNQPGREYPLFNSAPGTPVCGVSCEPRKGFDLKAEEQIFGIEV